MEKKTNIMLAIEFVSKRKNPVPFINIFNYVAEKLDYSEEDKKANIGPLYVKLCSCSELVNVGGNNWTLRDKVSYDSIKNNIEDEEEEDVIEEEDEAIDYQDEYAESSNNNYQGPNEEESDQEEF